MANLFGSSAGTGSSNQGFGAPQSASLFGSLNTSEAQQPAKAPALFGVTSTAADSSTFLKPPTSQLEPDATPARALFGSLNTQAPQQPSLFAASTDSSQPQQPSPFAAATTGQSQEPSLFAASTAAQPPAPQIQLDGSQPTGLFGGLGTQSGQPSLFPSTASTTQPQQSSLFASTTNTQSQPQASLYPSLSTNQPALAQSQQVPQGSQLRTSSVSSQPAYFDSLLEKGRQRPYGNGESFAGLDGVPSLQLGLPDISRQVRQLGGLRTSNKRGDRTDTKAHYLLAASGISPGAALRDLRELNAQPAAAGPISSHAFETDTGAYIANLQTQSTLALISESLDRSARDFDAFLERNVTMDWDAQRQKIYEHFGLVPKGQPVTVDDDSNEAFGVSGQGSFGRSARTGRGRKSNGVEEGSPLGRSIFNASNLQRSVLGSPGRAGSDQATLFADTADETSRSFAGGLDDRFLRDAEAKYAEKVQLLNEARLQKKSFPILQEFASVEADTIGDQTKIKLVDSYKALIEIVKEDPLAENVTDPNAVRERQFVNDYIDEAANPGRSFQMRKRIINGSRQFLEHQFFQELESLIAKYPREARLGGVPTTLSKVRAYVTLRASRRDLAPENQVSLLQRIGDDYCWVLIFYLLRSGQVREAVEYVSSNATAFRAIDRNFPTYITSYYQDEDGRLRRDLQERINAEYNQKVRVAPENSTDPYRIACHKIIGRCELSRRTLEPISRGVEDWMWLQFSLAREVNRVDEVAGEVFGLEEVRAVIREIGQRHFIKGQGEAQGGYGTYFFLQVLGGMFEHAVAYLYPFSYVSAVHFAIALDYYGLLRVSNFLMSDSELLTFTTTQLPQISFGRMIGYYTRDFRSANVEAAVDYLTLLCLNADLPGQAGKSQILLCHEALRELVLETREFAKLLGDVRSDGQRIKGAIESRVKLLKLSDQEGDFLRTLTVQAAGVANDNGRTTDAVLLYHLAEEYDDVITIINRALSEAIAVDIGQEQMRLQPLKARSQQQQQQGASSLSLTSVDDPAELARNMIGLYNQNALYYNKIKATNRDACGMLLRMSEAKRRVEGGQWMEALDMIDTLSILPLRANSQIQPIRLAAQAFNQLPHPIARTVPHLLIWTITCCVRLRQENHHHHQIQSGGVGVGGGNHRLVDDLVIKAKDLLVFAGLIRYHLPARVFDVLARAGTDVEGW